MKSSKFIGMVAALSLTSLVLGESKVSILLPAQLEADPGYDLALKELETVLEKKSYQPTIHYLETDEPLPDGNRIVVGDLGKENTIESSPLRDEAYRISQTRENAAKVLKIEGHRRGGMYGNRARRRWPSDTANAAGPCRGHAAAVGLR